jgi:predicted CopG family antitoxin
MKSTKRQKTHGLTTISVSYENYEALKDLGRTGDTFNNVLSKILKDTYRVRTEKVEESEA